MSKAFFNKLADGLNDPEIIAFVAFYNSREKKYVIAKARDYQKDALLAYESSFRKSFDLKNGIKFDLEIHCPGALFKMIKEDGSVQYLSFSEKTLEEKVVNNSRGSHVYL